MDDTATEPRASVGELLSDAVRDLGTMLRQEVELARVELLDKADRAKGGAIKLGAAAGMGVVGMGLLAVAAVLAITLILSMWMTPLLAAFFGALVVGGGLAFAAYLLFRQGAVEARAASRVPERTLESLKENAQWAKNQWR
jgi:hypothetical protein